MNSKILLVKNIHIDRQYTNVLSYTEAQMLELCQANLVAQADNYSFLRPTGSIMAGFTYAQCLQANYIAFQNPDYSNKWFFAWIDDVIYKGDKNTEIIFTVDAWSTWFDKWQKKTCFINRQHVNDDTIGLHTIPENLDVGEVIQESITEDLAYGNDFGYWIAVASNWKIKDGSTGAELLESDKGTQYAGITVYDNTVFGTQLFFFHITDLSSFKDLVLLLLRTNADGHIEDVQNLFILPDVAIDQSKLQNHNAKVISDENTFSFYTMSYDMSPEKFNTEIDKITSFSDYTPKNNKCFVYPYNYLFVSNNQGSNNIYKYEDFNTEKCIFENQFSIAIGGSGRIVPKNYKGMATNDDEALALGKYPTCAWSSDAFTNWLTQNSVNMAVSLGLTAGAIAGTIATGGATAPVLAGAVMSVAGNIGNTIGQFYQASLLPNINGGQANGDIIWACNRNVFSFRQMRVKTEYLKIIDDYFTRFGYAIKSLALPNITGRKYWNYVEIGSSEEIGYGEVPSKYMEIINNACRRGVTIWHNHNNVGNYNLDNTII
ncbi:MAG: major tail protein [Bacteriophage sp.]|nr:MAG: major tail protein [Bacteriophage sp.]